MGLAFHRKNLLTKFVLNRKKKYPLVSGLRVFKPNILSIPSKPVYEIRPHLDLSGPHRWMWLTVEDWDIRAAQILT